MQKAAASRKEYDEQIFNNQVNALEKWNFAEKINTIVINPFNATQEFKHPENIFKEMLNIIEK